MDLPVGFRGSGEGALLPGWLLPAAGRLAAVSQHVLLTVLSPQSFKTPGKPTLDGNFWNREQECLLPTVCCHHSVIAVDIQHKHFVKGFSKFLLDSFILCVYMLCPHVCVAYLVLTEAGRWHWIPGTGVVDCCELPYMCWNWAWALRKSSHLTARPPLHPTCRKRSQHLFSGDSLLLCIPVSCCEDYLAWDSQT